MEHWKDFTSGSLFLSIAGCVCFVKLQGSPSKIKLIGQRLDSIKVLLRLNVKLNFLKVSLSNPS